MTSIIRPEVRYLKAYKPGKPHEEIERELGIAESLKLASNENCLGPSPRALEAGRAELGSAALYPDGDQYYLKRKIAELTGFGPEHVFVGCGTTEIIQLLAWSALTPGHQSVFSEQAFIMYRLATQATGARPVSVPLDAAARHDCDALAAAADASTRLVFVANPSNPTGTYVQPAQIGRLLDAIGGRALTVVDEAYFEYVTAPDYGDCLGFLRQGRFIMVLRTFSKIYGLAGMRLGYALGPPEIVDALNRVRSPFNVTRVGLAMATAALDDGEHLARSREHNAGELPFLAGELKLLGVETMPSVANFVLADIGRPAEPIFQALLEQGVIVRPMAGYGFPSCLRITVGTRAGNLRLLEALSKVLVS